MSTRTEEYVNFVSQYAAPIVSIDEIKEHTRKDDTLSALKVLILSGEWFRIADVTKQFKSCNKEDLEIYKRFKEELTISAEWFHSITQKSTDHSTGTRKQNN